MKIIAISLFLACFGLGSISYAYVLPSDYLLYLLAAKQQAHVDKNNKKVPDIKLCDLISTNFRDSEEYFKGVDTVIHLAYKGSSKGGVWDKESPFIDRFSVEHENILMANNVYRAAYENGVKRVVVASSNHAADWYEHYEVHNKKRDMVGSDLLPYSDNFYGWSKASYELLSIPYASG